MSTQDAEIVVDALAATVVSPMVVVPRSWAAALPARVMGVHVAQPFPIKRKR